MALGRGGDDAVGRPDRERHHVGEPERDQRGQPEDALEVGLRGLAGRRVDGAHAPFPFGVRSVRSARPAARSSSAAAASSSGRRPEISESRSSSPSMYRSTSSGRSRCGIDRAVVGAEDALVRLRQRERVEARGHPGRREADDHRRAAQPERADRLLGGLDLADRVEHEVEVLGQRVARGHGVGRAEPPRDLELARVEVAGDDARRAGQPRALDHRQADAAAADHGDRRAGRHLGGVAHGADAGRHRAADDRHDVQRRVAPDPETRQRDVPISPRSTCRSVAADAGGARSRPRPRRRAGAASSSSQISRRPGRRRPGPPRGSAAQPPAGERQALAQATRSPTGTNSATVCA